MAVYFLHAALGSNFRINDGTDDVWVKINPIAGTSRCKCKNFGNVVKATHEDQVAPLRGTIKSRAEMPDFLKVLPHKHIILPPEKGNVIVSGFAGVGKTHFCDKQVFKLDLESSRYQNKLFPANYIRQLKNELKNRTYLMVSCHDKVRRALQAEKLPYVLVYPEKALKAEYMQRYIDRKSAPALIKALDLNWDSFVDSCEADTAPNKIVLQSGQYLSDVVDQIDKFRV